MVKVNLDQTRSSNVAESDTSQPYRNAQLNYDMKVLFVWKKKELFQRIE